MSEFTRELGQGRILDLLSTRRLAKTKPGFLVGVWRRLASAGSGLRSLLSGAGSIAGGTIEGGSGSAIHAGSNTNGGRGGTPRRSDPQSNTGVNMARTILECQTLFPDLKAESRSDQGLSHTTEPDIAYNRPCFTAQQNLKNSTTAITITYLYSGNCIPISPWKGQQES